MALPNDPLIVSRAERIQFLMQVARGELRERRVLPNGRVVETPAPLKVRRDAIATLRQMGVHNVPCIELTSAH